MRTPIVAAVLLLVASTCVPLTAKVDTYDLSGQWVLSQVGESLTLPAQVPGNVQLDLLREGKLPDPFYRENADEYEWIYSESWCYEREFELPTDWLQRKVVLLRCEGLDTVARIEINGELLANTDNMYRTWEFDVKPLLKSGTNTIRVTFSPIQPYIEAFQQRAPKVPNATGKEIANIRKSPYSNGWDFCARFLPYGIYKPISLMAYDETRVRYVRVITDLQAAEHAELTVDVVADVVEPAALHSEIEIEYDGNVIDRCECKLDSGSAQGKLTVDHPQLWWPNGMGGQPLYTVRVRVLDVDNQVVDETTRRIGLRDIQLLKPTKDRPLRLAVNGQEIYAKGANWIPDDVFPASVTDENLRQRVADAAAVNMNMLRVWGGGYYPEDAFFDACDEFGILVWSDFMFACAPYPGNNPEFHANVRAELTDQVRRLRHHPCMAVWCGNNEVTAIITNYKMITQEEYDRLFHEVIGTKVKELHPQANYVGGSPEAGDEHNWWVWHVGADFENYRDSHGWMTEFGFQSFPHPATVRSYTDPADRDSVLSPVNRYHQKNGIGKGNEIILDKMHGYFREPKDFESTLWLSQILQAYGMSVGIEHWRTEWPLSSGSLVWQYNDCWPGPTWSSVDYYGRWKAAHYAYRRVYAPVLVAGMADYKTGTVQVKVASDLTTPANATLSWRLADVDGNTLLTDETELQLSAGTTSAEGPKLELQQTLQRVGPERAILWLEIQVDQQTYRNMVCLVRPKQLELQQPDIQAQVSQQGEAFRVELTAAKPALWTWLECDDPDARYSDNFVHLESGRPVTIDVKPSRTMTLEEFQQSLKVRSLHDTYTTTPSQ
ncbi:beta-mannosidase [Aeoliella mucimassa]|uniref:Beta-mannosidase B n=1 Tax=Aeoliella mucimassa TaxID=2527972 RepID=A0A518AW71_9BACT|nr:glycoside hydrolase family 2 protein [Aeoliella mucimassa]QDU58941.1 Exo-beta-D-glucosaminidase precursor [Aeoliella mucimassa]